MLSELFNSMSQPFMGPGPNVQPGYGPAANSTQPYHPNDAFSQGIYFIVVNTVYL